MNAILPQIKQQTTPSGNKQQQVRRLIDQLATTNHLSKDDFLFVLNYISVHDTGYLFEKSFHAKLPYFENRVFLRGLIEISNYCTKGCRYCGINRHNKRVTRYRLTKEEILECCTNGYRLGYRTFVLQGGEDPYFTDDVMVDIITAIKQRFSDVRITLSLGEKTKSSYQRLYDAGADRYLLRHETASKRLYHYLHPDDSGFDTRMQCLRDLKEIGFQTGAGFMVGSPTQTNKDLVEDLVFLEEFQPHMIGIGPYLCHEDTNLHGNESGTLMETLILLALVRLILPNVLLPATTALGTLDKLGRENALKVGANVIMPNISPKQNLELYEIYQNKQLATDTDEQNRDTTKVRVEAFQHVIDFGVGDAVARKG